MTETSSLDSGLSGNTESQSLRKMANAIRALSMDAVEKAKSGHPGMPMGMADVATVLFTKFMKFDPANPLWSDRDRFILSGGHGSMLLYSIAYLSGYKAMTIDEIKNFRQLHSRTPGHPEYDPEVGIEITTGPLGQGISSAVGFALAERMFNVRFGNDLVDHYTYVTVGDGDLQEGVSHEACSLAGHLKLGKLIVLYDDNGITIDGPTSVSFTEDVAKRYEAYGWEVLRADGHDFVSIERAIEAAKSSDKPSLVCCRTTIGFGAPNKQGTEGVHGAPLGEAEIAAAREQLQWPYPAFEIPEDVLEMWREAVKVKGASAYSSWQERAEDAPAEFAKALSGDFSDIVDTVVMELKKDFAECKPSMATRKTSGKCLDKLVPAVSELIGGSADLTGSVNTQVKGIDSVAAGSFMGSYIHYGVREHGMAAIMNGMALHGGFVPYSGTFLQFADYSRPSIRLGALMKQRVIHVMTHDSIGLGEDGPTHQPVEHLASLRAIPNLKVFRPCDGVETAECWQLAIDSADGPSLMALTRQDLPTYREADADNKSGKGGYVLSCEEGAGVAIFATGSEVEIAMEAKALLGEANVKCRVISVPCMELLLEQGDEYLDELCDGCKVLVAVEAGIQQPWDRIIGKDGIFIGMSGFGDSAPYKELYRHFGITAENVVKSVKEVL